MDTSESNSDGIRSAVQMTWFLPLYSIVTQAAGDKNIIHFRGGVH